MITTIQKALDLREIAVLPLICVKGAASIIRMDSVAIIDRCDSGIIPWAFNLTASTNPRRRDIYILQDSVKAYEARDYSRLEQLKQFNVDQVVAAILPKPTIKTVGQRQYSTIVQTDVAVRFTCCAMQIAYLVRRGEIKHSPLQVPTPKHSPFLDYETVAAFLKRREITAQKGNQ